MRFSVLIEIYCGFSVFDEFGCGFAVSTRPQCPPPTTSLVKTPSKETKRLQRSSHQYESISRHRPETKAKISRKICSKQYPFEADGTCEQILLRFFQEDGTGDCSRAEGTRTVASRQNIAAAHSHKPRPIARFFTKQLEFEYLTNVPEFFQDL